MISPRVLFILKHREHPWGGYGCYLGSGLHNSARYVQEMLSDSGIASKLVHVVDNNCIDREVTRYRPTHVIIEAYWVVPEKFHVLRRLHPNVQWIVRNHSEVPFLAQEGMSMDWTLRYLEQDNMMVSSNSPRVNGSIRTILKAAHPYMTNRAIEAKTPLLSNFYPLWTEQAFRAWSHFMRAVAKWRRKLSVDRPLEVACFGAIRPLKNQLMQAIAAIRVADELGRHLNFHINATRVEGGASPTLKNLRQLFGHMRHSLVEHGWLEREDFLILMNRMDVAMQVSFSETFNIVAADAISQLVPIVVSKEVPWAVSCIADPTDEVAIANVLRKALRAPMSNIAWNSSSLRRYGAASKAQWLRFLK